MHTSVGTSTQHAIVCTHDMWCVYLSLSANAGTRAHTGVFVQMATGVHALWACSAHMCVPMHCTRGCLTRVPGTTHLHSDPTCPRVSSLVGCLYSGGTQVVPPWALLVRAGGDKSEVALSSWCHL
jgi:hypothetical protein